MNSLKYLLLIIEVAQQELHEFNYTQKTNLLFLYK
jgi:hypothetical protein